MGPAPPPAPRNDPFARAGGVVQQDQSVNDDLVKQHFGGAANMGVNGPGRAIDDQHAYGTGKGGKLIPIAAPIARSGAKGRVVHMGRSEEHTSELQSLMRISYAVFCLKKKK